MFIESTITSVVTPAAIPITASSVTIRSTAGRFGERVSPRYQPFETHFLEPSLGFASPVAPAAAPPSGELCDSARSSGNNTTSRIA